MAFIVITNNRVYPLPDSSNTVLNVFTSSMLSETNNEVEKITKNIERQELTNQGLSMQIDELASLENIQTIAENHGLSYNNSNIKTVGE